MCKLSAKQIYLFCRNAAINELVQNSSHSAKPSGMVHSHKLSPPSRGFYTLHSKNFLTLICEVERISSSERFLFLEVFLYYDKASNRDVPTELRSVKNQRSEALKMNSMPGGALFGGGILFI